MCACVCFGLGVQAFITGICFLMWAASLTAEPRGFKKALAAISVVTLLFELGYTLSSGESGCERVCLPVCVDSRALGDSKGILCKS